jgi:uncharacterized RDD family membrane protein YckC
VSIDDNPYAPPASDKTEMSFLGVEYQKPEREVFVLADRATRWCAVFVDNLVLVVAAIPLSVVFVMLEDDGSDPTVTMIVVLLIGLFILLFFAVAQTYWLKRRGQTLGKMAFGIRIVNDRGRVPSLVSSALLRFLAPQLLSMIPIFGLFFVLADTLMIFRADRRCLHDLMAGTRVVKVRP